MDKLKPCPFCGGDASITSALNFSWYAVECDECHHDGRRCKTPTEAADRWNRRPLEQRLEGALVRVGEMAEKLKAERDKAIDLARYVIRHDALADFLDSPEGLALDAMLAQLEGLKSMGE